MTLIISHRIWTHTLSYNSVLSLILFINSCSMTDDFCRESRVNCIYNGIAYIRAFLTWFKRILELNFGHHIDILRLNMWFPCTLVNRKCKIIKLTCLTVTNGIHIVFNTDYIADPFENSFVELVKGSYIFQKSFTLILIVPVEDRTRKSAINWKSRRAKKHKGCSHNFVYINELQKHLQYLVLSDVWFYLSW